MKEPLDIITGKEASVQDVKIIEDAFSDHFDVKVSKDLMRFSENELPLIIIISLGIASSAIWELIKFCSAKFFKKLPPDRASNAHIEINIEQKQVIIGNQRVKIVNYNAQPIPREDLYDSLDQAIEVLSKDEE
jgi:hypothetical protein